MSLCVCLLGGENFFSHNGFQTALYYKMRAEGYDVPVVGSTDSHGSTEHNRNGDICSTIVFAHANERTDIIASIKDKYSVAVDTISKEYRLVGEFRYQKYASFLMENWYPVHDRLAAVDGEIMRHGESPFCTADSGRDPKTPGRRAARGIPRRDRRFPASSGDGTGSTPPCAKAPDRRATPSCRLR